MCARTALVFGVLACAAMGAAQYPGLAWIKGSKEFDANGVFGTQGVAAPENTPVGRNFAAAWTDLEGNFWVYGGTGYAGGGDTTTGWRSDLWKYDVSTGNWTWVSGETTTLNTQPVHGTMGVANPANSPGARSKCVTWTGADGRLWLYGGEGQSPGFSDRSCTRNDLWSYDIATGNWTWVDGSTSTSYLPPSQLGVYGTQGVFAEENQPGSRWLATSWTDAEGNLWLFGGLTVSIGGPLFFTTSGANDLWKYDVVLGQWAWMKGGTPGGSPAVYGRQGVAADANTPGPRFNSVGWNDNAGNFWLMGGDVNITDVLRGGMNDVWKFDPVTNNWAWMDGSTEPDQPRIAGQQGVAAESNDPGGRDSHAAAADAEGNLWMFGGTGTVIVGGPGVMNDTWKYNVSTGQWTWVHGSLLSNEEGVYGTQGVPAPENTPGWRLGARGLTDAFGNVYFFGGHGRGEFTMGLMSDLWRQEFVPSPVPAANLTGAWGLVETKCKTNKKGVTKCQVKAQLLVTSAGNFDADKSLITYYLSDDPVVGAGDIELKPKKLGKMKVGKSKTVKVKLKLTEPPAGKFIIAVLDAGGVVPELSEADNLLVSDPLP